jgi:hypothetical protein
VSSGSLVRVAGPIASVAIATGLTAVGVNRTNHAWHWLVLATAVLGGLSSVLILAAGVGLWLERRKQLGQLQPAPQTLSGIWLSRYEYCEGEYGEHYVEVRQTPKGVRGRSIRHVTGSQLSLELRVMGHGIVSGFWVEKTSPAGQFGGQTFNGVLQVHIDTFGDYMSGKWLGFGLVLGEINTGIWSLQRVEESPGWRRRRRYQMAPYTFGVGFDRLRELHTSSPDAKELGRSGPSAGEGS